MTYWGSNANHKVRLILFVPIFNDSLKHKLHSCNSINYSDTLLRVKEVEEAEAELHVSTITER